MLKMILDEKELVASEAVVNQLISIFSSITKEIFDKQKVAAQAFVDGAAREKLYQMEREAFEKGATVEECKSLRPVKGQGASMKLLEVLGEGVKIYLEREDYNLIIRSSDGQITSLAYSTTNQGQAGG